MFIPVLQEILRKLRKETEPRKYLDEDFLAYYDYHHSNGGNARFEAKYDKNHNRIWNADMERAWKP